MSCYHCSLDERLYKSGQLLLAFENFGPNLWQQLEHSGFRFVYDERTAKVQSSAASPPR